MFSPAPAAALAPVHRVLNRRLTDAHPLGTGFGWLTATGLAYAIAVLILAAGGDQPGDLQPWLNIPAAQYFWWEPAFIAPVIVGCGLLATACLYLLARAAGGTGTFDETLALVGPAVGVCTLFTLIPDLAIGVLLNTGAMDSGAWQRGITHPSLTLALVWAYLLLYAVAFLVAFPAVVATAHRLRPLACIAIGWFGFVVYQGVALIFIR